MGDGGSKVYTVSTRHGHHLPHRELEVTKKEDFDKKAEVLQRVS
jgi:hypothetical protein